MQRWSSFRLPSIPLILCLLAMTAGWAAPGAARTAGPGLSSDLDVDTVFSPLLVPGFSNVVLFAENSLQVEKDTVVLSGDLVVNQAASGPTLTPGFELDLQKATTTPAGYSVRADSVNLDVQVSVGGDVAYNDLVNDGTIAGSLITPLDLPVFDELPAFEQAQPRFGAAPVVLGDGASTILDPGRYDALVAGKNATVTLRAGTYHFTDVTVGRGSALLFEGPVEVRLSGRLDAGTDAVIAPAGGSGLDGSEAVFYVGGFNGVDGQLGSTPPAASIGKNATLEANLYAPFGTLVLDVGTQASGAFLARDLLVKRESVIELDSAFVDQPPTADPQDVSTNGADPIEIVLTGSDPEDQSLTFAIVSGPSFGTLSAVTPIVPDPVTDPDTGETAQPPTTSATVTYTPDGAGDLEDSLVFTATDPAGGSGMATVRINPPPADAPAPPPPETVIADDLSDRTPEDTDLLVTLTARAPDGVDLTFGVLTFPVNGDLGPLTPGTGSPVRTATATYTPDSGFLGTDSFTFEACGIVDGVEVCDDALFEIDVFAPPQEPVDLAQDQQVDTFGGVAAPIDLSQGSPEPESQTVVLLPRAAFIDPALVAGNVADSNGDGLGDNSNDLPGTVPVFISAGVDVSGGAGSNGTVRIHIEFDLSGAPAPAGDIQSADVILSTHRGSVDSLDTFFFAGGLDQQGTLEDSDFESTLEQVPGVVMPVPDVPVGTDGTFSFSALGPYRSAVEAGADAFVVQGRVDESLAGQGFARGLEVRSSADSNVSAFTLPRLSVTTPGVIAGPVYSITSLPQNGILVDSSGSQISTVPTALPSSEVTYTPNQGFIGTDSFGFQADDGLTVDSALVTVDVAFGSCLDAERFCDDGR